MSYISPINTRYKAPITSEIWSPNNRVSVMRQLWIDLAICQKNLGLNCITNEGIDELFANIVTVIINTWQIF